MPKILFGNLEYFEARHPWFKFTLLLDFVTLGGTFGLLSLSFFIVWSVFLCPCSKMCLISLDLYPNVNDASVC